MKAIHEARAFNDAANAENRIHSDEIARQYGFEGALVSGALVFGYMTYPPMKALGETWLTNNSVEVRFLSPAYDGEMLTIEMEGDETGLTVDCFNYVKTTLASLLSRPGTGAPSDSASIQPALEELPRIEIGWNALEIGKPAPVYFQEVDTATNLAVAAALEDDLEIYHGKGAIVHPHWIMQECNEAFMRSYILPAWMHVGSKIRFHRPLRTGEQVETRMIPVSKWEKNGHQFTTLYLAFLVDGEVRVEAEHTSIFRIAPRRG